MTDDTTIDHLSRRGLLAAFGAAAAAGAAIALPGTVSASGLPITAVARPETLSAPGFGLTYLPIDAWAFFTAISNTTNGRYSDDTSGTGSFAFPTILATSLPLPPGSAIAQINIAYQSPSNATSFKVSIVERPLLNAKDAAVPVVGPTALAQTTGPSTQSIDLSTPYVTKQGFTYSLRLALNDPGDSVYGVTIGYRGAQSFVPFSGTTPRVYDSRVSGGLLAPGEDRVVTIGGAGASTAVFNLAITAAEGTATTGGYVGAYSAALSAWPGNASINWIGSGVSLSNTVICALSPSGQIKLRGGANKTHVVIDLIGYLV